MASVLLVPPGHLPIFSFAILAFRRMRAGQFPRYSPSVYNLMSAHACGRDPVLFPSVDQENDLIKT